MNETAFSLYVRQKPYNNSVTMANSLKTDIINTICGIEFDDNLAGDVPLPKDIKMTFRFPGELRIFNPLQFIANWHTDFLFPPYTAPGPRNPDNNEGASPGKSSFYFS